MLTDGTPLGLQVTESLPGVVKSSGLGLSSTLQTTDSVAPWSHVAHILSETGVLNLPSLPGKKDRVTEGGSSHASQHTCVQEKVTSSLDGQDVQ